MYYKYCTNKIKLFRQLYKILVSLYVSGPSQYRKYNAYNKDLEINLVFSHKYQYIGIKVNSNMKERLLIKCDTTIYADEITNLLIENNIVSRQHDEGQDQNPGAYGAITGIAIYVFGNHSIFRHDNSIGCFSADKIKMSARK